MEFFGYPDLSIALKDALRTSTGSADILKEIQQDTAARACTILRGQQTIGENAYSLHEGKLYYRTLAGVWYAVPYDQMFLLLPDLRERVTGTPAQTLECDYQSTIFDKLYSRWLHKEYQNTDVASLIRIEHEETTPDDYFARSTEQIRAILNHPVGLRDLENFHGQDELYLERMIKVGLRLINFVQPLRNKEIFPLYLLRDGMMFAEAQKTLDILEHRKTTSGQVMIGRALLSSVQTEQGYWFQVVDALYAALQKSPKNFERFAQVYKEELREMEQCSLGFRSLLQKLSRYLAQHVETALREKKRIVTVDTGLQGSVNMLTKYILDEHVLGEGTIHQESDIYMFVVGDWLKKIYTGRYASDYYPMMKDIEVFSRSEHVYQYKPGSMHKGELRVEMGTEEQQRLANIELMVLVMLCSLIHKER